MRLFDFMLGRKKASASLAKERLQIILAHERLIHNSGDSPAWLSELQTELVQVIAKYIKIDKEDLKIHLEKRDNLGLLEINVALPEIVSTGELSDKQS